MKITFKSIYSQNPLNGGPLTQAPQVYFDFSISYTNNNQEYRTYPVTITRGPGALPEERDTVSDLFIPVDALCTIKADIYNFDGLGYAENNKKYIEKGRVYKETFKNVAQNAGAPVEIFGDCYPPYNIGAANINWIKEGSSQAIGQSVMKITACDNELILIAYTGVMSYQLGRIISGYGNAINLAITIQNGSYNNPPFVLNGLTRALSPADNYAVSIPAGQYQLMAVGINWAGPSAFAVSLNDKPLQPAFGGSSNAGVVWSPSVALKV